MTKCKRRQAFVVESTGLAIFDAELFIKIGDQKIFTESTKNTFRIKSPIFSEFLAPKKIIGRIFIKKIEFSTFKNNF